MRRYARERAHSKWVCFSGEEKQTLSGLFASASENLDPQPLPALSGSIVSVV